VKLNLLNTPVSYGWISIALHWLMAVAIFGMFGLGVWMRTLGYYDRWYHEAPYIHKGVGILLLLLLLVRLAWRLANTRPELLGAAWEKTIALFVHRSHYVLLFAVMLTGYLIPTAEGVGIDVFGWFTVPATLTYTKAEADVIGLLHKYLAWAVIGLAGLHAAAAIKHHFVDRDATLLRMLGLSRKS